VCWMIALGCNEPGPGSGVGYKPFDDREGFDPGGWGKFARCRQLAQKRRSMELADWSAFWGEADPL
jgi:hypothetical protein